VARRKTTRKSISKGTRIVVVFWLVFVIVIIAIFMANAPTILKHWNLLISLWKSESVTEEEMLTVEEEPAVTVVVEPPPPQRPPVTEPATTQTPEPKPQTPPAPPTPPPAPQPTPQPQPPAPVQTRERAIYFTNVGSDGQILQSRVTRRVPASESPMQDSLNVLLAGPSADEVGKGILNLIPQNTRLLSATIRGNTAYLNFSEDFLFNTFGVEGYVAQLRQIVWTVTEFQNVKDVQILIEGRRLDYLGEGIWIGSPISRQSF